MYIKAKLVFASVVLAIVIGAGMVALIPGQANAEHDPNVYLHCGVIPQRICDQILGDPNNPTYDSVNAVRPTIDFIATILVSIFGSVLVLIVIISAVQITTSGGREEQIKQGKENIFKAVTGLVLMVSFSAIWSLVNRAFFSVRTNRLFTNTSSITVNNATLDFMGIPRLINNVITIALFLGGSLAVIFVIVGGIQYILAGAGAGVKAGGGGGEGIKKAKKTITYALAGLVISISAYGILSFIETQLQ